MKEVADSIFCVIDRGLFPHIAQCLAAKAKHVYYTGPPHEVMEHLKEAAISDGLENITRVDSLFEVHDQTDCFVFPDVGFAWEQKHLVEDGHPVWGHHGADELEVKKGLFLDTLEILGMAVPPHERIKGFSRLKKYLADNPDKYIKISKYRGDWETFHYRNELQDGAELDVRGIRLGPFREHTTFYVFDPIEAIIEDGTDTWNIDGRWPKNVLHAVEKKDRGLIGAIQPVSDIDERVWGVNEAFGLKLAEYGYRGPFSTEIRITENEVYFNDPTCRQGSPPSQLQTKLIKNLPEVILAGANGEVVEPEFGDEPVGAQALITSDREKDEWLAFPMDPGLREHVCSSFCCEVDGTVQIIPNPLENWAGWLVATGRDIPEVVERMKELKELLPEGFSCDLTAMFDLIKELDEAQEEGIEINDEPLPDPAIALDGMGK